MATTKKRSVDDVRFEIDQLRKEETLYAVQSCAITLVCLFGYFFTSIFVSLLQPMFNNKATLNVLIGINIALAIIAVGYLLVMVVGNIRRMKKIRMLEKEL